MNIKTQIYVRSNPNIYRYLREYSYWYNFLNRNPNSIKDLEKEVATEQKKVEVKEAKQEILETYNEKKAEVKEESYNKIEETKKQIENQEITEAEAYNNLIKEWNNKK